MSAWVISCLFEAGNRAWAWALFTWLVRTDTRRRHGRIGKVASHWPWIFWPSFQVVQLEAMCVMRHVTGDEWNCPQSRHDDG